MSRVRRSFVEIVDGWPIGLVNFALTVAVCADSVADFMSAVRNPKQFKTIVRDVPVKQWLRMYRQRRRICDEVGGIMGIDRPSEFISAANEFDRMSRDEVVQLIQGLDPEEFRREIKNAAQVHVECVSEMIDELEGRPSEDDFDIEHVIESPYGQFIFRVTMPVWIRFKRMPGELMRQARLGDINALCSLLAVDKLVICDHGISHVLHEAATAKSDARLKRIGAALATRSLGNFSKRRVKKSLVAFISLVSQRLQHPVTEPQIRALFDLVARAGGNLRDLDLPASSEGLSKAIQRERPGWNIPDKTRL